jgi:hypothetical protein
MVTTSLTIVGHEHTRLFHQYVNLDVVMQKYIKPCLQFQHKQIFKNYKGAKTMDVVETKYHVICSSWLSFKIAT